MPESLAEKFRADLDAVHRTLIAIPPTIADLPWRDGGWTRKQILGHLLDSATNNRQRFVRAAIDGQYAGPRYAQEAWVAMHGYASQTWGTLVGWWEAEHEILMAAVDHIPEDKLEVLCTVGDDPAVTLRFLIEDYLSHQRWHLKQMATGTGLL
jgi:DinB superfamily